MNGHVYEREERVQLLEIGRHVRRAEVEGILQGDPAIDHLDGLDLNRPVGARAILLARLALDQRAKVPMAVSHLRADDEGTRDPDAPDDNTALEQFADAVADRDFVDANQRVAAASERDVTQAQPAHERAFEAADAQRRGE